MAVIALVPIKRKGQTHVMRIDYEDWQKLKQYNWFITSNGYAIRNRLINEKHKKRMVRLHRELLNLKNNLDVDHINHNKLDNRRCNLRVCTRSQNFQNLPLKRKNNTSGYKGVSRDLTISLRGNQWFAQIAVNKKHLNLGYFKTKEEAAKAYNDAAIKYFGEFAKINEVNLG